MLRTRVIPVLLLYGKSLVKTVRFGRFQYIGDPVNTVRIFNELEVDELCVLDIKAARTGSAPDIELLGDIASECFMPLSYGGGIESLEVAKRIFDIGFEKVVVNSAALKDPHILSKIARIYGSQAVTVSIDVKKHLWRGACVVSNGGRTLHSVTPIEWARRVEELGAGEILLTSVDREGTWQGLDIELIRNVTSEVTIPVIAHGGAGNLRHLHDAVHKADASAVAVGSSLVFQGKGLGVLVHMPLEYRDL